MTSNGTHNFKVWNVGEMNNEINSLREQLNAKPKEVVKEVVREVIKEVPTTTTQTVKVENLVFVTFAQAKYNLTNAAKNALNEIKKAATYRLSALLHQKETHSSTRDCQKTVLRLLLTTSEAVASLLTKLLVRVYRA